MKKILTTTVITAILATNGFASEMVEFEVYDTLNLSNETNRNPITIMPSGVVKAGHDEEDGDMAHLMSDLTLQEGSIMLVNSVINLDGTLNINPNDAGAIPVQCAIDETLYYEYKAESGDKVYRLVDDTTDSYVDENGEPVEKPEGVLTQTMTETVTGAPIVAEGADIENALLDIMYSESLPQTATLPKDAKVITDTTDSLTDASECDLSEKPFYVYSGKLNDNETEIYSYCCYTTGIETLWKATANKTPQFVDANLGTSDVYVKGTFDDDENFTDEYYTKLADEKVYNLAALSSHISVTDVSLKKTSGFRGKICGGTVTYAKKGDVFLETNSTDLTETTLENIDDNCKFTISAVTETGFKEEYLKKFPRLMYFYQSEHKLNFSDTSDYKDQLSDSETLKGYLNSFGFYPESVNVLNQTGFDVLAEKDKSAAIQISADSEFQQKANSKTHEIKANFHNVDANKFEKELIFKGTWASNENLDTLVFSGDNRNLVPECGVTYTNVNVTVCDQNSWIAPPKDKAVQISSVTGDSTVTICKDLSIHHDLKLGSRVSFKGAEKAKLKIFGTLTFSMY